MKNLLFLFLATPLFFSACQQNNATEQLATLQQQLSEKTTALQQAQATIDNLKETKGKQLVHTVYLKLKPGLSGKENLALVAEISKLNGIEVVNNLEYGVFQDVGDARALSEYGLVMQMSFDNMDDYHSYQANEIHLNLKEQLGQYLAGPPATYDYWTE